jgi:hypothetical protein
MELINAPHPILFPVLFALEILGTVGGLIAAFAAVGFMLRKHKTFARQAAIYSVFASLLGIGSYAVATDTYNGNGRGGPSYTQPTCVDQYRGRPWALYANTSGTSSDRIEFCLNTSSSGLVWRAIPSLQP